MARHSLSSTGLVARISIPNLQENRTAAKARPADGTSEFPYPRRDWIHHRGSRLASGSALVVDIRFGFTSFWRLRYQDGINVSILADIGRVAFQCRRSWKKTILGNRLMSTASNPAPTIALSSPIIVRER